MLYKSNLNFDVIRVCLVVRSGLGVKGEGGTRVCMGIHEWEWENSV